ALGKAHVHAKPWAWHPNNPRLRRGGGRQLSIVSDSPPLGVQIARSTWAEIVCLMNATCPSPHTAIAPPGWKLNGSSFGPQLFSAHEQAVGPPFGVAWLLICATWVSVAWCGPDTPLATSGSAHR